MYKGDSRHLVRQDPGRQWGQKEAGERVVGGVVEGLIKLTLTRNQQGAMEDWKQKRTMIKYVRKVKFWWLNSRG